MTNINFGELAESITESTITYLYFIKAKKLGYIKIGTSSDPCKRLIQLQNNILDELELITYTIGDIEIEKALHKRFAEYNYKNEWFFPNQIILELINEILKNNIIINEINKKIKEVLYNNSSKITR